MQLPFRRVRLIGSDIAIFVISHSSGNVKVLAGRPAPDSAQRIRLPPGYFGGRPFFEDLRAYATEHETIRRTIVDPDFQYWIER